jgi:hypothetical protein
VGFGGELRGFRICALDVGKVLVSVWRCAAAASLVLEKLGSARLITMTGYFSATAVVVPAFTPHSEKCRLAFHSAALTEALDRFLPH